MVTQTNQSVGVVVKLSGLVMAKSGDDLRVLKSGGIIYQQDEISGPGNAKLMMVDGSFVDISGSFPFDAGSYLLRDENCSARISAEAIQHVVVQGTVPLEHIAEAAACCMPLQSLIQNESHPIFFNVPWGSEGVVESGFPTDSFHTTFAYHQIPGIKFPLPSPAGLPEMVPEIVPPVVVLPNEADLAIEKRVDYAAPGHGDLVTFSLVVTNQGGGSATNVQVRDNLPAGLVFENSDGNYNPDTGIWVIGSLGAGESVTLHVTALVDETASGGNDYEGIDLENILNTATVISDTHDPDLGNNQDTAHIDPQNANLSIDKSVNTISPNVGETIHYSLAIANTGDDVAVNVIVSDLVPAGLSISNISNGGVYDAVTHTITWNLSNMASGFAGTLTYDALVTSGAALENLVNVASIVSDTFDPVSSNNTDTQVVDTQDADLSLVKVVNNTAPNVGEVIIFDIKLSNTGHDLATGVQVSDLLPAGLSFVSAVSSQGSYDALTGLWTVGTVLVGSEVATLTIHATVTSAAINGITNIAEVIHSDVFDPDSAPNNHNSNEDDQASVSLNAKDADLSLTKTVDNTQPNQGQQIIYTIVLHNNGYDTATGVQVKDLLPSGVSFVSADTHGHGAYNVVTGIWDVGSINNGDNFILTVVGTANNVGSVTNTAEVIASGLFDPDSVPNNHNANEDDQASSTIIVNGVPVSQTSAVVTIAEEALSVVTGALVTGTNPVSNAESATGSLSYSFGGDGAAAVLPFAWGAGVTASDPEAGDPVLGALTSNGQNVSWNVSGNGLVLLGKANGQDIIKVELLNINTGDYKVTLLGQLDHPDLNQTGGNDQILLHIPFTIKDATGDTVSNFLNIKVNDDGPVATAAAKNITEGNIHTNLLLIIDISGSMSEASGLTGLSRMDVQKSALNELLDQYDTLGNVAVRIVTFSTNADPHGSTWESVSSARTFINGLTPTNSTNYDEALTDSISAFGSSGKTANAQNVAYFLSDGEPNQPSGSAGINTSEENAWINFLQTNDVNAFALGLGPSATASTLNPVSYNGTINANTNAIIVTNFSDLAVTLTSTVATASGNILTDMSVNYGADQTGHIQSVMLAGDKIYAYDVATDNIIVSGSGTSTYSFNAATNVLTISAGTQGTFALDFDDGAYAYNAPANLSSSISPVFTFTFADFDHDSFSQNLAFNVNNADLGPIVRDDHVITNITGNTANIVIPDYALLYNDSDPESDLISLINVSGAADGNVSDGSNIITFTDNDGDGGRFTYTGQSNSLSDTGLVTIDREQAGENTLDGTGLGDILIARNSNTTLNGNEGNDVLLGGTGNDTLNGGVGDDYLSGGAGNNIILGGKGNDIIDMGGGNDTAKYTGILDGTDVLNNFDGNSTGGQDTLDLTALFDSLGISGAAARSAKVQVVNTAPGTVDINVDAAATPGFDLHVATIHTPDSITVGAGQDVVVGS